MTPGPQVDAEYVERVRAALAELVAAVLEESPQRPLEHRELARRVLALIVASSPGRPLLGHAHRLAERLRGLQAPDGLFVGGDNVDSPPDSAFSINDVADSALLLRRRTTAVTGAGPEPGLDELLGVLEGILDASTPALVAGGVHTPNHRWELSAALARLHRLSPQQALADRIEQWLAEGVDIDADGLYSERSANYAAYVSNPSLLAIADVLDRPDLVDAVERNLTATLDLLLPDGTVETVLSRRQDQRGRVPLAAYLLPLRQVAVLRRRADLAWAAGLALRQGVAEPAAAAASMALDPRLAGPLPPADPPPAARRRLFGAAGLLVDHRPAATTVVFGGSDYPVHRRIRSGLANSPTFLRVLAGRAVLDSVRLSRDFFDLGPFRSEGLTLVESGDAATAALRESVAGDYYQPVAPSRREPLGSYQVTDNGRFSAAMDFALRETHRVSLTTTVDARISDTSVEIVLEIAGPPVGWALELAFRPGGELVGADPLGQHRWQLAASGSAVYAVGEDSIAVTVVEAGDGGGGALVLSDAPPAYDPGEDYRFLGGTDAATGELLYVAGRAPSRLVVRLEPAQATGQRGYSVPDH